MSFAVIILVLRGGLGNQLFQLALYRQLLEKSNKPIAFLIDISAGYKTVHSSHINNLFSDATTPFSMIVYAFLSVLAKSLAFLPSIFYRYITDVALESKPFPPGLGFVNIYDGYWQDLQIAESFIPQLQATLDQHYPHSSLSRLYSCPNFSAPNPPVLAIHIRRGDFFSNLDSPHAVCTLDWYERAIGYVESLHGTCTKIIFSDDNKWVRSQHFAQNCVFFDLAISDEEVISYMQSADHFVISNSTFSYWSALLAFSKRKYATTVVAPYCWYQGVKTSSLGLVPMSWTLLK